MNKLMDTFNITNKDKEQAGNEEIVEEINQLKAKHSNELQKLQKQQSKELNSISQKIQKKDDGDSQDDDKNSKSQNEDSPGNESNSQNQNNNQQAIAPQNPVPFMIQDIQMLKQQVANLESRVAALQNSQNNQQ